MDEKRSDSSPSRDTNENRSGTISPDGSLDAPTPGEAPDGGWAYVTQAHYDPAEPRDLTTVIVCAIADAEGVPIVDVKNPPLYEVVDVAGIDAALFGRQGVDGNGSESTVEFRYDEYRVSVQGDGWVTVSSPSVDSPSGGE